MLENGSTIVKQFYVSDAAIRDSSKQDEILDLVVKLNTILFASTIDNSNLNSFNSNLVSKEHKTEQKQHQIDLNEQKKFRR